LAYLTIIHTVGIEPRQLTSMFNYYKILKPCGSMPTIYLLHVM